MKISLIQMNSVSDKAENISAAVRLVEQACAEEKPDWIGLPECFDFLGGARTDKMAAAESLPGGPAYCAMQELARRHGVFIHAGSILEKVEGEDRIRNTTIVFDRTGAEIARYRKIHMFDITAPDGTEYRESAAFAPGGEVVTYSCEGLTIGCAICYDLRFPALFQALVAKGAQMIVLPAAFTQQTGADHWEVLCRARAIETQTYFAAPAQTGVHMAAGALRRTYGHSLVADPWGHIIAKASDGVGMASARIDEDLVRKVRAQIPVARHKVRFDTPSL
ncbi:carbon-nitrogen hydrolase family protein [Methylocapsa palsarum]|uniref:Nitrilase n=1 Tax=Methylocapsa palsarum TaxID=1612308 RepID=A0A1I4BI84_9HYPH|nr:carbon-nitrogen hydrolase family protein [Methylocapsa palsarum]SFK68565.1 nitrilase [Methylocapsa palsarum]